METRRRGAAGSRASLVAAIALVAATGCRGKHSRTAVQNEEPEGGPRIASSFRMNEPAATAQLPRGVYGLEGGSWRWTAGAFSAILRPPLAAAQHGATLKFSFSLPEVVVQKLGAVTLTASSGGTKLKSETYSKPGSHTYAADVPGEMLAREAITFDFRMDKSMPAGSTDQRELGLIAVEVGLESK